MCHALQFLPHETPDHAQAAISEYRNAPCTLSEVFYKQSALSEIYVGFYWIVNQEKMLPNTIGH